MADLWQALFEFEFMRNAFIGGFLAALGCGLIGPFVVVRRMGAVAGGLAHSVLGGMGLAYFLGASPLIGALGAAVIAALIISWAATYSGKAEESVINALWAGGMALGVILIMKTPGYNLDLMSYLFGNVLLIPTPTLYFTAGLVALILMAMLFDFHRIVAVSFDAEFAKVRGLRIGWHQTLLLVLIALTVVCLVQVVGIILVIALLTMPAATCRHYAVTLPGLIVSSTLLGALCTTIGLVLSYQLNAPAGATITLVAAAFFALSYLPKAAMMRRL